MKPAPTTTTFGRCSSVGADRDRIGERAQHEDPGEVRRARQRARRRAGGDHEAVEGERLARVEGEGAGTEVDGVGAGRQPEVEIEVVVVELPERELLDLGLPREEVLRQRRPVVRELGLGADEHEAAVEPLTAQGLDRAQSRERRAHHRDRVQLHAGSMMPGPEGPGIIDDPCAGGTYALRKT